MNAPTPPAKGSVLTRPLRTRTTLLIFSSLALAAVLAGAGWWLSERLSSGPKSPRQVRAVIQKFLKKQTGRKDFKSDLASILADNSIWEAPPPVYSNITALVTNLIGGTNRITPRTIRRLISPPTPTPDVLISRPFHEAVNQAEDYKTLYGLIGQELYVVGRLLEDPEPRKRAAGVGVAAEVSLVAQNSTSDPWLAARVVEGYVLPDLALVESNRMRLDVDGLLDLAENAFKAAGETNNVILTYRMLIAKAPDSGRADKARVRLAALLAVRQEWAEALKLLREVKNPSARVQWRISEYEARLKMQKRARR